MLVLVERHQDVHDGVVSVWEGESSFGTLALDGEMPIAHLQRLSKFVVGVCVHDVTKRSDLGTLVDRYDTFVHIPPRRDRKSTRLNSSHSSISYAVFCLKKKKMQNQHHAYCLPFS